MQNYYYQPPRVNTSLQQTPFLKGRPVSSLDEVRAATIDFDGSVSFFPDLANGKIYTKQCNIDGTAQLNMYELKEIPLNSTGVDYVTREEFNKAMQDIKTALTPKTKIEQPVQTSPMTTKENPPEFNF